MEWIGQHKAAAVVAGVGGLAVLVGGVGAMASSRAAVEVTDVVAGDVVAVASGDDAWQVSLLNLETPTECLADEARAFLADTLPEGTAVRLEEGLAPTRPPGPTAAGVVLDGVLVNAEVARAGLGIAVVDGTDATFYDEVLEAQEEAATAGRGLYSTESECTVAGRVAAYAEAAGEVEARAVVILAAEEAARRAAEEEAARQAAAEAARPAAERAAAEQAAREAAGGGSSSGGGGSSSGGSGSSGGGGSAYYKNCDAVRAAGAAPLLRGQPGYRSGLDRDNDGVACER